MSQWVKPRRTMTPPPSLTPAHRVAIPNITDLISRYPAQRPIRLDTSGAKPTAVHPSSATVGRDNAADYIDAGELSSHGSSSFNAADMVISYSVSEFLALRNAPGSMKPSSAVEELATALREACTAPSTPATPGPAYLSLGCGGTSPAPSGAFTRGGGGASPMPAGKSAAPRKKYFDTSALHLRVLAVLNKVSSDSDKYAEVRNELHRLPLPTASDDDLKKVSEVFFLKATQEPKFASEYALLVAELAVIPPGKSTVDESKTLAHRLRVTLISRCQSEFERTRALLWDTDGQEEDEIDRHRRRYRETLRFVGELYLHRVLSKEVIKAIVIEILPPFGIPTEFDIDGVCAMVTTAGKQLISEEPAFVSEVLHRLEGLSHEEGVSTRAQCLLLNVRDLLRPALPPTFQEQALVAYVPPRTRMDDKVASEHARHLFFGLASSGDFDKAIQQLAQEEDIMAVLHHGVGRALTTPRADKERQQLPRLMRLLVERRVLTFQDAQSVVFGRAVEAVDEREWTTSKVWKHWAQVLAEDTEPHAVLHQTMHTDILVEICVAGAAFQPVDADHYLASVLTYNEDRQWLLDLTDPIRCPRFRYLAVLVAVCGYEDLDTTPVNTVRRLTRDGKIPADIEARLFVALCDRDAGHMFDEIQNHPHRASLLMVQKVMGAILAAAVAMQDIGIALESMDLLHLVVDGPDRGLREALTLSEIVESGTRMHRHLRSSGFGFQLAKTLKDRDVVSESTLQEAFGVYHGHPNVMDLLGPPVSRPFISAPSVSVPQEGPRRPALTDR
jgi:hypothetical protein